MSKYVHGFKEADLVLRDLPTAVENKVLQSATRAGGSVWVKAARAAAPRGSGLSSPASKKYGSLVRNITARVLRNIKSKGRRGVRVSTGKAFWGFLIEFGTRFISPKPWFRPAIEANDDAALKAMKAKLGAGVEKEATKLARRTGVR